MSNSRLHRWAPAILVVVLFAGAPFVVKVLRPEDGAVPALEALPAGARAPAPDFTLSTLEGRTITLSDLGGQPVVQSRSQSADAVAARRGHSE